MYSHTSFHQSGMEQFTNPLNQTALDSATLLLFYDRRDVVLAPFVDHSAILEDPYRFDDALQDNVVYRAIAAAGLASYTEQAISAFPHWEYRSIRGVKSAWAASYEDRLAFALIDCALYLVHLLNIYEPNRALIANLFFSNRQTDALGDNDKAVVAEIFRLILRVTDMATMATSRQAEDILMFLRRDLEFAEEPNLANREVEFERHCAAILTNARFDVRLSSTLGDFGADIIASIDDLSYAIQCKDTNRPVGVKGVLEAIGAREHYGSDYAVVCATSGFTEAAIDLAASRRVTLCTAHQLVQMLLTL